MARDITVIPKELLCTIFDLLPVKDQLEASRTCVTWSNILSDHRFSARHKFQLTPYIEAGGDLDEVKYFRNFAVGASKNLETMQLVSQFLCSEDVSMEVEELDFENFHDPPMELFGKSSLNLPQLKKLWCMALSRVVQTMEAPALNQLVFNNDGLLTLVMETIPFVEQLNKLTIKQDGGEKEFHLASILDSIWGSFEADHSQRFRTQIIPFMETEPVPVPTEFLQKLVSVAAQLQSLHIHGLSLSIPQLHMLAGLVHLQELTLTLEESSELQSATPVTLPNLIRLTVDEDAAHLLVVENLRVLSIIGKGTEMNSRFSLARAYPQLVALRITDMVLTDVRTLCRKVPQLKILELAGINIEREQLDEMLGILLTDQRRMQRICFKDCSNIDRGMWDLDPALGERYRNHVVVVSDASLVETS